MVKYIELDEVIAATRKPFITRGELRRYICSIPATDVVKVIRCKDCKWFGDFGCSIRIVDESDKPKENDYCSFGERKEESGDK